MVGIGLLSKILAVKREKLHYWGGIPVPFLIAFIETKRFFFISADGITYTQGIYVSDLKTHFNEGSAAVSWISSILVRFFGILSLIAPKRFQGSILIPLLLSLIE